VNSRQCPWVFQKLSGSRVQCLIYFRSLLELPTIPLMFSCPTVSAGALVSEGLRMLASPEALVITNGRTVPSPLPVPAVCVSFFYCTSLKMWNRLLKLAQVKNLKTSSKMKWNAKKEKHTRPSSRPEERRKKGRESESVAIIGPGLNQTELKAEAHVRHIK